MPLNIQYWKEQSDFFAMDEIIDHPEAAFGIPLRRHMADAFENHKPELVAQQPNAATILPSIGSSRIPRPPIILRKHSQFLPDFVDPGNSACIGHSGVTIARVDGDFVPV